MRPLTRLRESILLDIGRQVDSFFGAVAAGTVDIYNEFSLQHELGLMLRSAVRSENGRYRVEFERPAGFFGLKTSTFVKKEIDISIVSADGAERIAIELKFPRCGQHPEQMFKFCQDMAFVEEIRRAGLSDGYFIAAVDDPLFYSGSGVGIYGHFSCGRSYTWCDSEADRKARRTSQRVRVVCCRVARGWFREIHERSGGRRRRPMRS